LIPAAGNGIKRPLHPSRETSVANPGKMDRRMPAKAPAERRFMPIYEFYCPRCNTIYNFFSRTINTTAQPWCPRCRQVRLNRQMSAFAITGRAKGGEDTEELPIDEQKMARAMETLSREAEQINEDDPRQAAALMRKLSHMTGMELGPGMDEAIRRMERGEDPEAVEAEMGDLLEGEEPFVLPARKSGGRRRRPPPRHDETLYEL
jgi:putative FmdB family regulatory protein